jgi:hypothetical protein
VLTLPCAECRGESEQGSVLILYSSEHETQKKDSAGPAGCHSRARSRRARCGRSRTPFYRPCRIRNRCLQFA